jgi:hypothetical protein
MRRLPTVAGVLAVASLVFAQSGVARRDTTAPPPAVNVTVTITDVRISVTPKIVARGTYARFVLENQGSRTHAFMLGSSRQKAGVQAGFARMLKPGARRVISLMLYYRGDLPYRGVLAADRGKTGMRGTFTVS